MSIHESQVWQVLHEYDEFIPEKSFIPSKVHKSIGYAIEFFQHDDMPEKVVEVQDTADLTPGYLWITNKRVVFIGAKSLIGKEPVYKEFTRGSIAAITHDKKMFLDRIVMSISTTAASGSVKQVAFEGGNREGLQEFVRYAHEKMKTWTTTVSKNEPPKEKNDFIGDLERLSKLKEQGLISEDEFQAAKGKLLGI